MTSSHYPVIVLGGGTMGTGAAWALGKRGVPALVLEQFQHVHTMGAHSGQTRIIRHAYAESPDYVPLVLRADELWQELEGLTGAKVLHRTGGLDLSGPGNTQAADARRSAEQWNLPIESLSSAEVQTRWPQFQLPDDWEACYSPSSGFLRVEPALHALGEAARSLGVTINENETVSSWQADGDGVKVESDSGSYTADRLIITAGPWAGKVLSELGLPLTVLRKILFWFAVEDPDDYAPERFPIFIADTAGAGMYGFPIFGQAGLKVAEHTGGETVDPSNVDRTVHPGEEARVAAFVSTMLRGVTTTVVTSATCLYTMTPDEDFILDRLPGRPQVVVGAGFSGHGFKFTPAIGEELTRLALEPESSSLARLRIDRFSPVSV